MCLKKATEVEEKLNKLVLDTIEELVVGKIHAGDDEFDDAGLNFDQARNNLDLLEELLAELEREAAE